MTERSMDSKSSAPLAEMFCPESDSSPDDPRRAIRPGHLPSAASNGAGPACAGPSPTTAGPVRASRASTSAAEYGFDRRAMKQESAGRRSVMVGPTRSGSSSVKVGKTDSLDKSLDKSAELPRFMRNKSGTGSRVQRPPTKPGVNKSEPTSSRDMIDECYSHSRLHSTGSSGTGPGPTTTGPGTTSFAQPTKNFLLKQNSKGGAVVRSRSKTDKHEKSMSRPHTAAPKLASGLSHTASRSLDRHNSPHLQGQPSDLVPRLPDLVLRHTMGSHNRERSVGPFPLSGELLARRDVSDDLLERGWVPRTAAEPDLERQIRAMVTDLFQRFSSQVTEGFRNVTGDLLRQNRETQKSLEGVRAMQERLEIAVAAQKDLGVDIAGMKGILTEIQSGIGEHTRAIKELQRTFSEQVPQPAVQAQKSVASTTPIGAKMMASGAANAHIPTSASSQLRLLSSARDFVDLNDSLSLSASRAMHDSILCDSVFHPGPGPVIGVPGTTALARKQRDAGGPLSGTLGSPGGIESLSGRPDPRYHELLEKAGTYDDENFGLPSTPRLKKRGSREVVSSSDQENSTGPGPSDSGPGPADGGPDQKMSEHKLWRLDGGANTEDECTEQSSYTASERELEVELNALDGALQESAAVVVVEGAGKPGELLRTRSGSLTLSSIPEQLGDMEGCSQVSEVA